MAAEILASSLINKVSFKVDFASYRTAIRTINRVKDEMKKLNKTSVMAASPSAAKAQVRAVRKQASEMANAHVQTFGNVIKARTASQKQFMQNFLGQNDKQIKGAAKASANVFAEAFASKPIFGPSKQDFLTNKAQAAAAALQAKRQAGVDNRIGAKSSAFGYESEKMTRLKPNEIAQYTAKVKLLNEQYRSGSLPLIQYNERMRQLTGSMRTQNAESLTLVERLRSVRSQLLFAGLTGGMALKSLAETGKDLENTGIMMSTVFGDQVGPQMQFLRDQSNRLGISFQDSAKNFSQMMFAGQQAGMSVGEMQDIFLGVTEASKVFGMSQDETAGSMRAIIQMFS